MKVQELITAIAEIADIPAEEGHPLLSTIKFILATANEGYSLSTKKGGLKQGIKEEDFDDVIKTAINTPIKMRYLGYRGGVGNHLGSIPIGHITKIDKTTLPDGVVALAAEGVLYTNEYPDEIEFLKTAHAAGEGPGISYEIKYDNNKSVIEDGTEWIKGLITQAATIVRSPAYGNRTAILALASNSELTDDELNDGLRSLVKPEASEIEGGSDMDKDKEIERLTALASEKESALTAKAAEIEALTKEFEDIKTKLAETTSENEKLNKTILLEKRVQAYSAAGLAFDEDAEKATAKKELLAKMDEDVFSAYLADLSAVKDAKKSTALASASDRGVPNLRNMDKVVPLDDLKAGLRGISRR